MRIVVVDFAASTGGATSILMSFYNYLIESNDINEWFFLLSDSYIKESEKIKIILLKKEKKSRFKRLLFDFIYGKKIIEKLKPDVVFYFQNTLVRGIKVPQVAYMDQSIPFQNVCNFSFFDSKQRTFAIYQHVIGRLIKKSCKIADRIIVQTEWMKNAIADMCGVPKELILKMPPMVIDSDKGKSSVFNYKKFIFPANNMYYKNHRCIINALSEIKDSNIIVTFTTDKFETNDVRIKCIGNIKHEEIMEKLSCQTLIFPSYIETYGLPLAEARSVGTIILASDTPFSHEILDGYKNAYFFNPFNHKELVVLIEKIINKSIKRIEYKDNFLENSAGWREAIEWITTCKEK